MAAPRQGMGIDLGSTYSRVGVWRHDRVEIVPSKSGDRSTPVIVAFTETEVLIGEPATHQLLQNAENTVFDITRMVGRKFSDPEIQKGIKHWPFKVVSGPNDNPLVVVTLKGESKSFRPVEILAMFLSELCEMAESYTHEKIEDAVVTMPVSLNHSQRQAIKDAGRIAGLSVVRLISGSTAASVACGLGKTGEHSVLVLDMGGSTLDLSLVVLDDSIFDVKATVGIANLGGHDFDACLVDHCVAEFRRTRGENLRTNSRAMVRLRNACERAKRTLSTSMEARIELDSLYEGVDFTSAISRSVFEDCCADLFDKTLEAVTKVLEDARVSKARVGEVVLVGGSSRVPRMQRVLTEFFDGRKPNASLLEEAAATGAAMQAAILTGRDESPKLRDLLLLDVVPQSFQVEAHGATTAIIPRNCSIPTKKTQTISTFPDTNSVVRFRFYEGDDESASENLQLGVIDMNDIPNGESEFEVTLDIDANFVWSASVVEKSTGKEKKAFGHL